MIQAVHSPHLSQDATDQEPMQEAKKKCSSHMFRTETNHRKTRTLGGLLFSLQKRGFIPNRLSEQMLCGSADAYNMRDLLRRRLPKKRIYKQRPDKKILLTYT